MKSLSELWSEPEVIEKFHLLSKSGRSRKIGNWVRMGLKCIRLSGNRYFKEEDIIEFIEKVAKEGNSEA